MNTSLNASSMQPPISLRQAVEEQLDLILKLEEDRKALKKENKILTQKLLHLTPIAAKYQVQTVSCQTNTSIEEKTEVRDQGIQIEIENPLNTTTVNHSKLTEAKSLLTVLDLTKKEISMQTSKFEDPPKIIEKVPEKVQSKNSNKQISDQIVKMSKEINTLRRELKDCDHKLKIKDKEIKDLKKCLDTKTEALEKVRKDFNELSNIFNTDKYKSIRSLQSQIIALKGKLAKQESQEKLKKLLQQVTTQYQAYKEQSENKIEILVSQLAMKEKQIEDLFEQNKKLKHKVENLN